MTGFLLVVLFPLIAGLGFGGAKALLPRLFKGGRGYQILARQSGWIYLFLLSIPVSLILFQGVRDHTLRLMGVRWPEIPYLPPWAAIGLAGAMAWLAGVLLYLNELILSFKARQLVGTASHPRLAAFVEGQTASLSGQSSTFGNFMSLGLLISLGEEFLWRGFLIYFLTVHLAVVVPVAVLITALLFGINHAYFGARNVFLKAIDGVVWGGLLVATSSLLAPFLSHLTFQYLVWRRMRRRAVLKAAA